METQNRDMEYHFLPELPLRMWSTQCVWFNEEELLILGGYHEGNCYSYHTIKGEYKLICQYPETIEGELFGHVVIKWDMEKWRALDPILMKNRSSFNYSKQMILLSFGGQPKNQIDRTWIMKYQSVWEDDNDDNDDDNNNNESITTTTTTTIEKNEWIIAPFHIGQNYGDMWFTRAVIGGSNNQLLFVIYPPDHIEVWDFTLLKPIKRKFKLPFSFCNSSCFVKMNINDNLRHMQTCMIIFYKKRGFSLIYDERNFEFTYETLPVCSDLHWVKNYSYICLPGSIVVFGGYHTYQERALNKAYVYSMKNQEWNECFHQLPIALYSTFAILDKNERWVHIVGGNPTWQMLSTQHLKIKIRDLVTVNTSEIETILKSWIRSNKIGKSWISNLDRIIIDYIIDNTEKNKKKKKGRTT